MNLRLHGPKPCPLPLSYTRGCADRRDSSIPAPYSFSSGRITMEDPLTSKVLTNGAVLNRTLSWATIRTLLLAGDGLIKPRPKIPRRPIPTIKAFDSVKSIIPASWTSHHFPSFPKIPVATRLSCSKHRLLPLVRTPNGSRRDCRGVGDFHPLCRDTARLLRLAAWLCELQ